MIARPNDHELKLIAEHFKSQDLTSLREDLWKRGVTRERAIEISKTVFTDIEIETIERNMK